MTAPRQESGHWLPSGLGLGDRRGLTAAGAVVVALLLGAAGGVVDLISGAGLREIFAVGFVTGCVITAFTVHREDLVAVVVMPPLVYVALVLLGAAVEGQSSSGSFLTNQAIEIVNALILGAPVLMAATGAAFLIALVRSRR